MGDNVEENIKNSKSLDGWIFTCPKCKEQIKSLHYTQIVSNAESHMKKHGE